MRVVFGKPVVIGLFALLAPSVLALTPLQAAAQRQRADWERDYQELRRVAAPCREADRTGGPPHVIQPEREATELAGRMLATSPASCPGVAAAALEHLKSWVGTIERPDADDDLLRMLHRAASRGLGGPPDPALAERTGRMLWLISEDRPRLAWNEEERWAFLLRSETIALLEARARSGWPRPKALLGEALLRKGSPAYDPVRGIEMLEASARSHQDRLRVGELLTDGRLIPADHQRAARLWLRELSYGRPAPAAAELLRIGRLGEASARAPAQQAAALRILSAAAIDGGSEASETRDTLLRRQGAIPTVEFPAGLAAALAPVLAEVPIVGVAPPDNGQRARPVLVRALIGPDGRVVATQLRQGTGEAAYDRAVLVTWAVHGTKVDLSGLAEGRFVWTELPPLMPRYATDPS